MSTTTDKDGGVASQRTVVYRPTVMSFREYDKKMRTFRPDLEYWELVLTEKNAWDALDAQGVLKYSADEIKSIKKADRIAKTVYVLGNGGTTDVYTEGDTAYEIREALRSQYENTESWGLTELTEKYNDTVHKNPMGCPDEWFNKLQYYVEVMVRAGGAAKTPAEIVAHVIATAPRMYDTVTTLLSGTDLKDPEILKIAREQYRNYWKRHFENRQKIQVGRYRNVNTAYHISNSEEKVASAENKNNRYVAGGRKSTGTGQRPKAKPWKKFKGHCRTCGTQGHKAQNCPSTRNQGATTNSKETRSCYNCGLTGHLSKDCTSPRKQKHYCLLVI